MSDLTIAANRIAPMSDAAIANVRSLENLSLSLPQISIATTHILHAGLYARTIVIPAGVVLTGALIKRSTLLIVSGDAVAYMDGGSVELSGYNTLGASANRKQAFVARTDTVLTMLFATSAVTVEEAEAEFTDEGDTLFSRLPGAVNHIIVTGE